MAIVICQLLVFYRYRLGLRLFRLLFNLSVHVQNLCTLVLSAGGTNPVSQMRGSTVFACRKTRSAQSEMAPSIISMTSVGTHSNYHMKDSIYGF